MLRQVFNDKAKIRIRRLFARAGLEIGSYTGSFSDQRRRLLADLQVETLWDVGAHVGQYASSLRDHGYSGHIISVEPGATAHADLATRAHGDGAWTVVRAAAGTREGPSRLNISSNGQSSSLLPMLPRHVAAAPDSTYIAVEEVQVVRLDAMLDRLAPQPPFALKLDVQGYELATLEGASRILAATVLAEVELSLTPLYEGGADWTQLLEYLATAGLQLCNLERVYHDPISGDLLQINGLFRRVSLQPGEANSC